MAPNINGFQYIRICVQYLASHPHKPIFYNSNSYDVSNVTIITWGGNQVEDYTTHNCLEFRKDADHARIINIRRSGSVIFYTLLCVAVFWKVQIQPSTASESTYG